jgi:hypothetical protein
LQQNAAVVSKEGRDLALHRKKKRTFDEAASTQIAATATSEKRPIEKALCWGLSKKKKKGLSREGVMRIEL